MADLLCPVVVGRDAELEVLDARLDAALRGRGGCVVLTGEAGIGKSRLVRHVVVEAGEKGVPVATGRAVPSGASGPYRPLTEALLQALRGRPFPDDPSLAPWLPALGAIVPGVGGSGGGGPSGDTSAAVRGEAVVQLLGRIARPAGMVLVFEDLHWADPDTVAVVEYLGDNLTSEPVLCVVTVRSEPTSPAFELANRQRGRAGITHLPLARLEPGQTASMIRACDPDAGEDVISRVQRTAEGVPLLVEDLLVSPGVPSSFLETVRERLCEFSAEERAVINAAAVLGRHFDWELLGAVTGVGPDIVTAALERGVDSLVLAVEGDAFRFRHALTREAVMELLLPPHRQALALKALEVVETAHPRLEGVWRDTAADLAARAGDLERAGVLLAASGRAALERGALATAADTLRRAVDLFDGHDRQVETRQIETELTLLEALALAGRMDEAAAVGVHTIERLSERPNSALDRARVHVRLAQAAGAASRWPLVAHHVGSARALFGPTPPADLADRITVLEADAALVAGDTEVAQRLAWNVIESDASEPEVRCHALEIAGRAERLTDLAAARVAFERALSIAEAANMPVWRMRALHELGTIELFDHSGIDRLADARRSAQELGAVSTAAVIDLQLSATFHCRWALEESEAHARAALALADRLGLEQVRSKALCFLAENCALAGDPDGTEHYISLTLSSVGAADEPALEGFCWGGRGLVALIAGDVPGSLEPFSRGAAILNRLPNAEPAAFRALWPVVLASMGDPRATSAIEDAGRLGVAAIHLNRGLLSYARAIVVGRAGDSDRANDLVAAADPSLVNCETWRHVARLLALEAAATGGWGDPERWVVECEQAVAEHGLDGLSEWSSRRLVGSRPHPWADLGVTPREAQVLGLIAEGLTNKDVAARLGVSPRTVEKHVEALLRKTSAQSRTQLAVMASRVRSGDWSET